MFLPDISVDEPRKLTQAIVQISDMLGLYRAETARILDVRCGDIGELFEGKRNLVPDSPEWEKACLFLEFYSLLFKRMDGDGVLMCHWLRASGPDQGVTPLLEMVDNNSIENLIKTLKDKR